MSSIVHDVVSRLQGKVEDKSDVQSWQLLLSALQRNTVADVLDALSDWASLVDCLVGSLQTSNPDSGCLPPAKLLMEN